MCAARVYQLIKYILHISTFCECAECVNDAKIQVIIKMPMNNRSEEFSEYGAQIYEIDVAHIERVRHSCSVKNTNFSWDAIGMVRIRICLD